jgi:hypothetical protein
MANELKRMTFAATPDMKGLMDEAKQIFYGRTQSDVIRTLVVAGLTALKEEKLFKENERGRDKVP